ncbi:hypothetical protein HGRIS_006026 [Hohenbuehelia grisea]|uniref:F-box domain-containing protein n=1 Tax=Hohenbuehelia grisea TaxID=104357 RepID=A0ABR3JZ36_9AGAR
MSTSTTTTTSTLASADSLPAELLIIIFNDCADVDPLSPLALTAVCKRWSMIALNTPAIWQTISLDTSRLLPLEVAVNDSLNGVTTSNPNSHPPRCSLRAMQRQAALWAARSAPLPLKIHLRSNRGPPHAYDSVLPLIMPLLNCLARWQELRVYGPDVDLGPDVYSRRYPVSMSHTRLEIHVGGGWGCVNDPAMILDVSSFGGGLSVWSHDLPSASDLEWGPGLDINIGLESRLGLGWDTTMLLTTLTINEYDLEARLRPRPILRLLAVCPALELFAFIGIRHTVWEPVDELLDVDTDNSNSVAHIIQQPMPVPRLLHLYRLDLHNTNSVRTILSHLHAPNLSELHLSHLNVEYTLPEPLTLSDGDSDSGYGSGDFSRSPSSDRALGMGLRALIKRCRPRLRVLNMDYSDMRAKDFKWVFEHLHTLAHFTIIASDMSDHVLELLRPRRQQRKVEERGEASIGVNGAEVELDENTGRGQDADATSEDDWEVLLPSLGFLHLSLCDLISGSTLVDIMRTRVAVTEPSPGQPKIKAKREPPVVLHEAVEGASLESSEDLGQLTAEEFEKAYGRSIEEPYVIPLISLVVRDCARFQPEDRQALATILGKRFVWVDE